MNENCKYCKTAKTCLENAEYNSIYCQLHKRIPKVINKTYDELLEENKQLKYKQKEFIECLENIIDNLEKEQSRRFNHTYEYKIDSFKFAIKI